MVTATGGWGLLRLAGLPVETWLEAGSPELFAALRRLDQLESEYRTAATVLAADIGRVLVPHPRVDPPVRRRALACRRSLHNGLPVSPTQLTSLADHCRSLGLLDLADHVDFVTELSDNLRGETDRMSASISDQHRRLRPMPWMLLTSSAVGRRALLDESIPAAGDVARRLAAGESWDSKRLRQRSDYLWRMIARAAMKTTPRGWLSHVALVELLPRTAGTTAGFPRIGDQAAACWTENLHSVLVDGADTAAVSGDTVVGLTPLHTVSTQHLHLWTVEPADPSRLRSAHLRLTPTMLAIRAALANGARPAREVVTAILTTPQDQRQRATAFGLLEALIRMGVLQSTRRPPVSQRTGWQALSQQPTRLASTGGSGFLDVHRRLSGRWPAVDTEKLSSAVKQALRLAALMRADHPEDTAWMTHIGGEPRPVIEVLGELLDSDQRPSFRRPADGWSLAQDADSGYAKLLDWIGSCADSGACTIELTEAVLDTFDAPQRTLTWPVDCTVRPLNRDTVFLDTVGPAGIVDARFATELAALHGRYPLGETYRDFLRQLDATTGVHSVELLVPALSERAANAVRRPLYPRRWTGDPDLTRYCPPQVLSAHYLPLSQVTVRRSDHRLVVEAAGTVLRVLNHATRTWPPPWDLLAGLLVSGAPGLRASAPRLRHPLKAFPHRAHLPRLTLAGVIVAGEQWRLDPTELCPSTDSDLDKLRRITRLRDRLGWPRWVFLSAYPWVRPVPCDLDSIRAVDVIQDVLAVDRPLDTAQTDCSVLVEETLPAPNQVALAPDKADGHLATELLLRLPTGLRPTELAELAAAPLTPAGEGNHSGKLARGRR